VKLAVVLSTRGLGAECTLRVPQDADVRLLTSEPPVVDELVSDVLALWLGVRYGEEVRRRVGLRETDHVVVEGHVGDLGGRRWEEAQRVDVPQLDVRVEVQDSVEVLVADAVDCMKRPSKVSARASARYKVRHEGHAPSGKSSGRSEISSSSNSSLYASRLKRIVSLSTANVGS
jgi:hypothetical protein